MPASDVIPFSQADLSPSSDGWRVTWRSAGVDRVGVQIGRGEDGPWQDAGFGGSDGELTISAAESAFRPYVRLEPDTGAPLTITTRAVGLASSPNLRDAGGYRTSSGQWVRMGRLYRAGVLTFAADELEQVSRLGLRTSYDLRTPAENDNQPDVLPEGAVRVSCNVSGTAAVHVPELTTVAEIEELMTRAPVAYLTMPAAREAYATLLRGLADRDGAAVYHCTAGKDRTGWASALVLGVLGVPEQTLVDDYLLSNVYYLGSPAMQAHLAKLSPDKAAVATALIGVQPAYLQSGLDAVRESFGSMIAYATDGLGVEPAAIERIRAKLLVGQPQED